MDYKVNITDNAYEDLDNILYHLIFVLKNEQAANNVLDDFKSTIGHLPYLAGSLKLCENPNLRSRGYRKIQFQKHDYFMMYRVEGNMVTVDNVFHNLQDFEKKMK